MFIHVFETKTYNELVKRGAIPLKMDGIPYICMIEEDTKVSFDGLDKDKYEFSDIMYF